MSVTRWRLADFLAEKGISAYALAKHSEVKHPNTVYRIARPGHEPSRVDLPTLTAILDGLRKLTGENVQLTDILVYDPSASPEAALPPLGAQVEAAHQAVWQTLGQLKGQLGLSEEEMAAILRTQHSGP